jgi:hypothetical protein
MKEIVGFIKYSWNSWEFWQKALVGNIFLQAGSWLFPHPYRLWISAFGWLLLCYVFFSWWWKDLLLTKWTKYKEERNHLLNTIKNSDK